MIQIFLHIPPLLEANTAIRFFRKIFCVHFIIIARCMNIKKKERKKEFSNLFLVSTKYTYMHRYKVLSSVFIVADTFCLWIIANRLLQQITEEAKCASEEEGHAIIIISYFYLRSDHFSLKRSN